MRNWGGVEAINREISNLEAKIAALEFKIPTNVATQDYVNTKVANYLPLSGGILTGNLNANNHYVHGLLTPIGSTDATSKWYVDKKLTIMTQTFRLPQRNITANHSFNGTLNIDISLNKFIGVVFSSNTELLYSYNLSVNESLIDSIYVTAYNYTSFDTIATISCMVQYYA